MTLRAPLYSLPRPIPGPASFDPPNLLEGTLQPPPDTPAPFSQTEWPVPRAFSYIPQSWAWSLQSTSLLSPFAQSDWPIRALVYAAQTWIWSAQIEAPVEPQPFAQSDWPIRTLAYVQQTWTWTQQIQPLQATPFYQTDWPIPQTRTYPLSSRTWAWQVLPPLNSAVPFNQTNWELTRGKPLYIAAITQSLLGLYAPPPAAMPFNQFDWPLPRKALRLWSGVELRNPTLAPPATVAARLRMLMGVGV